MSDDDIKPPPAVVSLPRGPSNAVIVTVIGPVLRASTLHELEKRHEWLVLRLRTHDDDCRVWYEIALDEVSSLRCEAANVMSHLRIARTIFSPENSRTFASG